MNPNKPPGQPHRSSTFVSSVMNRRNITIFSLGIIVAFLLVVVRVAPTPPAPSPAATVLTDPSTARTAHDGTSFSIDRGIELEKTEGEGGNLLSEALDKAAENPQAALEWTIHLSDNAQCDAILADARIQETIRHWAEAQLKLQGANGPVENFVHQWASADLPTAYAWVNSLKDVQRRDQLMGRIVFVEAQTDPAQAANRVVQQISPGSVQTEAAIAVLHQWSLQDTAGASSWVQSFPEGELRNRAMNELDGIASHQRAMANPEK